MVSGSTHYLAMKSLVISTIFILSFLLILNACETGSEKNASENTESTDHSDKNGTAVISFEKTEHSFGSIITGERVAYGFRFTNTGTSPLIITGIRSGCGCTVGDYPRDALKPGESGRISVIFNSAGRRGFQSESVRVLNNSDTPAVSLRITAEVMEI